MIDTAELDPGDRVEAVRELFVSTQVPYVLGFQGSPEEMHHEMHHWAMSSAVQMLQTSGTGLQVARGPREIRGPAPERVTLSLQVDGRGRDLRDGERILVSKNELMLTDQTRIHDFSWSGTALCKAVVVDHAQLALPVETIRAAIPRLADSPLYQLVRAFIAELDLHGDRLDPTVQTMMAGATSELVRGLILTAGDVSPKSAEILNDTLFARFRLYIEDHLRDRTLSVGEVAHAHHVSLRQLYKVWSANSATPPAEWIVERRLESARIELAHSSGQVLSIGALAEQWGFADSAHFSRRFRAAFGVSPREWRASRQR